MTTSVAIRSDCDSDVAVEGPASLGDGSRARRERQLRAAAARKTSGRRRFIDPTTTERDYSAAELEFMLAIQTYKISSGRNFPTWSEVLEVIVKLGYCKPGDADRGR